jgi:soluble lytic murein transglycosylase-like protein
MPFVRTTLRRVVVALAFVLAGTSVATAADTDETQYATLLRTINPHLQVHQSQRFAHSVVADAERSNLDPRLIVALVTVESHWRPNAISRVGARGLGQLMPSTAATLGVNAWNPIQNIRGAATYLRAMLDHFADSGDNRLRFAIGAYNAGPKAVDRYHGIPPYTETQNYVRKVLAVWRKIKVQFGSAFAGREAAPPDLAAGADGKLWLTNANASALPVTAAAAAAPAPEPATTSATVPAATPALATGATP